MIIVKVQFFLSFVFKYTFGAAILFFSSKKGVISLEFPTNQEQLQE